MKPISLFNPLEKEAVIRIALRQPLESKRILFGTKTVEVIVLRRPLVRDIMDLDFTSAETKSQNLIKLVSRLSGISVNDVESMSLPDWSDVVTAVSRMVL